MNYAQATEFNTLICEEEIIKAERKYDIPKGLLLAISSVESSMKPYAINNNGISYYPESYDHAERLLKNLITQGQSNIDIGCMQLNWRWHQENFLNPQQMLNPVENIEYAAKFLISLHQEAGGSWHQAVRYYHTRNPTMNKKYSRKIAVAWLKIQNDGRK